MNRDQVVIRTPCGADWDSMDPRGNARFCGSCEKLVHDLSAMTELEARALLGHSTEQLCVRYLYDVTGQIWFQPRPLLDAKSLSKRNRVLASALAAAAPVLFQACGGANNMDYGYERGAISSATPPAAPTAAGGSSAGAPAQSAAARSITGGATPNATAGSSTGGAVQNLAAGASASGSSTGGSSTGGAETAGSTTGGAPQGAAEDAPSAGEGGAFDSE